MKCPVCSAKVADGVAACIACGTNFTDGEWAPAPEPSKPALSIAQLLGLTLAAVVGAALATGFTFMVLTPPTTGDGGHIALFWLVMFVAVLAEGGPPLFGMYLAAALLGVYLYARRRRPAHDL